MALPSSGPISLSQVNTELSLSSTTTISMNQASVRSLFGKASGAISMSDGYGKSSGPTVIGQAFGGGYYGGKINVSGTQYYLIVSDKSVGQVYGRKWGINGVTTGVTSDINGNSNTSSLGGNASYQAAFFCEQLTTGGYSDWYLPAKFEIEVLYYFLKPLTANNSTSYGSNPYAVSPEPVSTNYTSSAPPQTTATDFQNTNSQAFVDTYYWASTEQNDSQAWCENFNGGFLFPINKELTNFYTRAIRRVAV